MAQSSNVQLKTGTTYQATVALKGLQVFGTNAQVEDKFKSLGFVNVTSTGSGSSRLVKGMWVKPDQLVEMPDQVSKVREAIMSLV